MTSGSVGESNGGKPVVFGDVIGEIRGGRPLLSAFREFFVGGGVDRFFFTVKGFSSSVSDMALVML